MELTRHRVVLRGDRAYSLDEYAGECQVQILELGTESSYGAHVLDVDLQDGWAGLAVVGYFDNGEDCADSLLDNGVMEVPPSASKNPGTHTITFTGSDSEGYRVSTKIPYRIRPKGCTTGSTPPPDPDVFQQFVQQLIAALDNYFVGGNLNDVWTKLTGGKQGWAKPQGGGGTGNYNDLSNKPQINGNELIGNKTWQQLGFPDVEALANAAAQSAQEAQTSAGAAGSSASAASGSATAAQGSASTASTKASEADTSAQSAAQSASDADQSAQQAADSASDAASDAGRAEAAANKIPTPTGAADAGKVVTVNPDGVSYSLKFPGSNSDYKSLINASEYTNSGYAGTNFDQFGANVNVFSGEADTSSKKQIYYRLCRDNQVYDHKMGVVVACYDADGTYLYKMQDNSGDYQANFAGVSRLSGTISEPLETLESGKKIIVKQIALLTVPEEVKKIKIGCQANSNFVKEFYPLFFASYDPITNYGSITDGDFSPVEGGGSSDLARPLTNKTVLFIGDSLTNWGGGSDSQYGFLKILHDRTGALTINQGLAGATWEQADGQTKPGVVRVDEYIESQVTYDCVCFLLGTNVANQGQESDPATEKTTMCGAIKYCLDALIKYSPTTPILVFLPPQRAEGNDEQKTRNDLIQAICQQYAVSTFDLYGKSQIVPDILVPGSDNLSDGLHLADNGIDNMGRSVCRAVLDVMGY